MTISEMLGQSGLLTLLGMCVVFGFLIILIFCMKLLHAVVHALKLDKGAAATTKPKTSSTPVAAAKPAVDQGAIIAAIVAAIHEKESN
ncbi:MAG: OadG family protein [Treponema sp.]|nr:OadG family protein [Treponema sp.]